MSENNNQSEDTRQSQSDEEIQKYEYEKTIYDYYLKERSETIKLAFEMGGRYEKFYMFITGGAFISSLTFIESLAPNPIPYTKWLISIAWLTLALGMIITLFAIFTSQNALIRQREILDLEQWKHMNPEDKDIQSLDSETNDYIDKVKRRNSVSFTLTAIGLICLILFVIINYIS